MATAPRIAVLGAGRMGGALVQGWVRAGLVPPDHLLIYDRSPNPDILALADQGAVLNPDPSEARPADLFLLAIKPQTWRPGAETIAQHLPKGAMVISVMAGITLPTLAEVFPHQDVVRVMPSTPASIGQGVNLVVTPGAFSADQHRQLQALLAPLGHTEVMTDEDELNRATALSGCGPAYVFLLAECMIKAGIEQGLSPELARTLTLKTISGSAALMEQAHETPETLKTNVMSKGGMTAQAVETLSQAGGLPDLMREGVAKAIQRGRELAAPSA